MLDRSSIISYLASYVPPKQVLDSITESRIQLYSSGADRYFNQPVGVVRYRRPFIISVKTDQSCVTYVPTNLCADQVFHIWKLAQSVGLVPSSVKVLPAPPVINDIYSVAVNQLSEMLAKVADTMLPDSVIVIGYPELYMRYLRSRYLMQNYGYDLAFVYNLHREMDLSYHERVQPFLRPHVATSLVDRFDLRLQIEREIWRIHLPEKIFEGMYQSVRDNIILAGPFRAMQTRYTGLNNFVISRPWGRDMSYALCKRLVAIAHKRVYFWGGAGFLEKDAKLEDLLIPTSVTSREGTYEYSPNEMGDLVQARHGKVYNVNSHLDESSDFLIDLVRQGFSAVEMELFGILKACDEAGDESPLAILYSMDTPLGHMGLMDTYYNPEKLGTIIARSPGAEDLCIAAIFDRIYQQS